MRSKLGVMFFISFSMLYGDITGVVFKDFNLNGKRDANEIGVNGVNLFATCSNGAIYFSDTSVDGKYILKPIKSGVRCRVEARVEKLGFGSGANGEGDSHSTLTFVDGDTKNYDISVASPATFCQKEPEILVSALPGGESGSAGNPQSHGALFTIPTPKKSIFDKDFSKRKLLKTREELGAVWGIAYKKSTKTVYASSVIRRYVPLLSGVCSDEDSNKNGCAGVIYKISDSGNGDVEVLTDLGNSEVGYKLKDKRNYDGTSKQRDQEVIPLSGRAGLGDLEITDDGKFLYTINLYKKELIKIDSSTGRVLQKVKIPNPYGKLCKDVKVRPWALKIVGNTVFVGSLCEDKISAGYPTDADHSKELGAVVQRFDGSKFTILAKTNTLNYLKPRPYDPEMKKAEPPSQIDQNNNWRDSGEYNQPMLTDIEFDSKGNLLLAYSDRGAFIRNRENASSDIRRMCINQYGRFIDESTNVAPTDCKSYAMSYIKGGNSYYEFFRGDFFDIGNDDYGLEGHPETSAGALAVRGGDTLVHVLMTDSTGAYEAGSVGIFDDQTGDKIAAQGLINTKSLEQDQEGEREIYGSKAGGVGDIELLCDSAPIEVGNYVWNDKNGNGIQDPDEFGIPNVKVEIHGGKSCSNDPLGTTRTNSKGEYYFGGINNLNIKNCYTIKRNRDYSICIPLSDPALKDMKITLKDAEGNKKESIDSDVYDDGDGFARISFKTKPFSSNNHNLDCGFVKSKKAEVGDRVWNDKNENGIQEQGEGGIDGIKIYLYSEDNTKLASATTANGGEYKFTDLDEGKYYIKLDTTNLLDDYKISPQDRGDNDKLDSDINPLTGRTESFELKAGDSDMSWDIGLFKQTAEEPKFCIGDFVWSDKNHNGIQEKNEQGISGVKLILLPGEKTVTTKSDGKYQFCDLKAGDYTIVVDKTTLPKGYEFTKPNAGDDTKDSDINPKTAKSGTIKLKDKSVANVDVGLYKPEEPKFCIGDFVWSDSNRNGIQEIGERGVKGVKLILLPTRAKTKTDENGNYQFCGLKAGKYTLIVDRRSIENGYFLGTKNATRDKTKDSDINPLSGKSDKIIIKDRDRLDIDVAIISCKGDDGTVDNRCQGDNCDVPLTSGDNDKTVMGDNPELNNQKMPKIDIEKYLNGKDADDKSNAVALVRGDDIEWKYVVSNLGDETLENIVVKDDKEGEIECPKTSLAPSTKMICIKNGVAKFDNYRNIATVTATGATTKREVTDSDSSWYTTKYLIGTHFWIDTNKDGIYQEGAEEPIPNAVVELFDGDGNKVAQTVTNEKGEYHFLVDAGDYYVKFHLPDEFKKRGFVFDEPKGNDENTLNANNANNQGITRLVSVGPNADDKHKIENLTLDAGINCGCDAPGIEQGSGDALGRLFVLLLIFGSLLIGVKEIERKSL